MKTMIGLIVLVGLGYVGICTYLFFVQRSMIYYPTAEAKSDEATVLLIDTGEATVKVWRVGAITEYAVLYFGGNAENVSQNIVGFQAALPNYTIYFVNYRGYGGSSGTPSEQGIFHDALYLYDQLTERHNALAVIGRSLGSGVATKVATERNVNKLVLVTPFDSITNIAQAHFNWLPVSVLIRDRFDSQSRAAGISCPTLVLIASDDEVIPRSNTDTLVRAIEHAPLTVVEIAGATHNSIGDSHKYLASISNFLL